MPIDVTDLIPMKRRDFLKQSASVGGALAVASRIAVADTRQGNVLGANDRIRLGLIGCGALGYNHHIPTLLRLNKRQEVERRVGGGVRYLRTSQAESQRTQWG